eukprot:1782326-Pyramimonas_sp.AAC.1
MGRLQHQFGHCQEKVREVLVLGAPHFVRVLASPAAPAATAAPNLLALALLVLVHAVVLALRPGGQDRPPWALRPLGWPARAFAFGLPATAPRPR